MYLQLLHMDRISCCNVKKSWIKNIIFLVWNSRFGMIFYVLNFFRFGIPYMGTQDFIRRHLNFGGI